jgi:hypothetical protein
MATRSQNEREFDDWEDLDDGGRRYWFDRRGGAWGFQRIVKIVDADENTLTVLQEIYNDDGILYERHQKFPQDTGHQILREKNPDERKDES